MSDAITTKHVLPVKETKKYEVEVYLSYYEGSTEPYATAHVVGSDFGDFIPAGDVVERYVFEVERPTIKAKKLKGQLA